MGALRLFLAIGVVFSHFEPTLDAAGWPHTGALTFNIVAGRAVCLFYVVSGFLISYALHHKYPQTCEGTLAFYRSRFLRIYPLWWAVLFGGLLFFSRGWIAAHGLLALLPGTLLVGSDWIVAFWAYPDGYMDFLPPFTGIAWTLGPELAFYLVAPWLLRNPLAATTAALGSIAIRFTATMLIPHHPTTGLYIVWTYFFAPSTFVFFMIGHFSERLSAKFPLLLSSSLALLAAALFLSTREPPVSIDGLPSWGACLCFALALPGLFAATKDNRILNYCGDLTYPLYLTHSFTIDMLQGRFAFLHLDRIAAAISEARKGDVYFILVTLLAIAVAAVTHHFVEQPLRWSFSLVLNRKTRELKTA